VAAPINETPDGERLPDRGVWQSLLDEFRALGGVAENLALRPSATGGRLFPENPDRPVLLRVPANLVFPPPDIALKGDCIAIEDSAGTEPRERVFFERYHAALSWGGGGYAEGATLIDMFDSLQPELQKRLVADFGMRPFIEGERRERIFRYFLRSRAIRRRRETYLAPFLDLMNRSSNGLHAKFGPHRGVRLEGNAEGEIFLAYQHHDALGIFNKHGIAGSRLHALSVPMHTRSGPSELAIGRDPMADTDRAGFRVPQMRVESGTVHLSYLTVGNAKFPRLPRAIFYDLMREARVGRAEEIFDQILFVNRTKFLALLEALEPHRGELVSRLRSMAHFQLAALAECVGAREL